MVANRNRLELVYQITFPSVSGQWLAKWVQIEIHPPKLDRGIVGGKKVMGNQFLKLDFHSRLDFFLNSIPNFTYPRVVGIPSPKKKADPQILICLHISTTRWHVHNYRAFPPSRGKSLSEIG